MLDPEGYGLLPLPVVDPGAIAGFDCGKPHLNSFLVDQAHGHHQRLVGRTTVVFHESADSPVGYFTLANDAVPLTTSEHEECGIYKELKAVPAVKIGRFAIAKTLQRGGVGRAVFELLLGGILGSNYLSAARLLVLDADVDPNVVAFYKKLGFIESLWAAKQQANHRGKGPITTVKMYGDVLPA